MNKYMMTMTVTAVFVAYNNFTFFNWGHYTLDKVNESSRITHAKELLGKFYKGSSAQKLEGRQDLNLSILQKVQNRLKAKWKPQAESIAKAIIAESTKREFDPVFVMAIIQTESNFNPLAKGSVGEIGLMQLRPNTAEWIARKYNLAWNGAKTLENPVANIRIGVAYMAHLRNQFDGASYKYVSAYNMGPNNVKRLFAQQIKPKEYSSKVMRHYKDFYGTLAANKANNMQVAKLSL